jgi:hypothetical protein
LGNGLPTEKQHIIPVAKCPECIYLLLRFHEITIPVYILSFLENPMDENKLIAAKPIKNITRERIS